MLFLKNLHHFLDECRLYQRKIFPRYQWDYIQSVLSSHQYMTEILSKFSSPFFEKIYDASVLHYDGLRNHTHDVRYNSRKNIIFSKIRDLIKEHIGSEEYWQFDKEQLLSGYYRRLLLNWEEVQSDSDLSAYVDFLFNEFESSTITVTNIVVSLVCWGGVAIDKQPFLAALRDSQQAYEDEISQAIYSGRSYSCMNGLEDRIGHFYGYLDTNNELPLEEQPLPLRYLNTATMLFMAPCSEYGFKPTPLLYTLYVQTRLEAYNLTQQSVERYFIQVPIEHHEELKGIYVEAELARLFSELDTLYARAEGLELRCADIMRQKSLSPWSHLLASIVSEQGSVLIEQHTLKAHFANYFEKEVRAYSEKVEIDDSMKSKINSLGLQSFVSVENERKKVLKIPDNIVPEDFSLDSFCALCESFSISRQWVEFLYYLPGNNLFEQLERWFEQGCGDVISLKRLNTMLEKQQESLISLEKELFDAAMSCIIEKRKNYYADYLTESDSILDYIRDQLKILAQQHDASDLISSGLFIFAQDSLTAICLFDEWLSELNIQVESIYDNYDEDEDRKLIHIESASIFVEELIKHGYDNTLKFLFNRFPALYTHDSNFFIAYDQPTSCTMLQALCQRPLFQASISYCQYKRNFLLIGNYYDDFQKAISFGNLYILEQMILHTDKEIFLSHTTKKAIPNIITDVIDARDPGIWAWFQENFEEDFHIFEDILSLEDHPVNQTLLLPGVKLNEINRIIKIYPHFLKKFINSGIEHEPFKNSLQICPEISSVFLCLPGYQNYLFENNGHIFIRYFEDAIEKESLRGAQVLIIGLKEYLTSSLQSDRKGIARSIEAIIIKHLSIWLDKNNLDKIMSPEFRNIYHAFIALSKKIRFIDQDITRFLIESFTEKNKDIGLLRSILNHLYFDSPTFSLTHLADYYWDLIFKQKRGRAQKNLSFLTSYGFWPQIPTQEMVLFELIKGASEKNLVNLLKAYYHNQPLVVDIFLQILKNDSSLLGMEKIKQGLFRYFNIFSFKDFQNITALIEQRDDSFIKEDLFRKIWCRKELWANNMLFFEELLGAVLVMPLEEAKELQQQLLNLGDAAPVSMLWQLIDAPHWSCVNPRPKLELLLALQKSFKTLTSPRGIPILYSALKAMDFEFANMLAKEHPILLQLQYRQGQAFEYCMSHPKQEFLKWALEQEGYDILKKEYFLDYLKYYLMLDGFSSHVNLLTTYSLNQKLFTAEKLFELWQDCNKISAKQAIQRDILSRCSQELQNAFFNLKKQKENSVLSSNLCLMFSHSLPGSNRKRKKSRESIER